MNATELTQLIQKRHPGPAWVTLSEVRNGTGFTRSRTRTADALAFSVWPSNGLCIHGFEIKISKNDLVKELKDPTKAGEFSKWCHYWWLVVSNESITNGLAIPETWGILAPKKGSLGVLKAAPRLDPSPIDMPFVCSVMRSVQEQFSYNANCYIRRDEIEKETSAKIDQAIKNDRSIRECATEQLEERIKKFEEASGVQIDHWNGGTIGEAVKIVMNSGVSNVAKWAKRKLTDLELFRNNLEKLCKDFENDSAPKTDPSGNNPNDQG